MPTAGRSPAGFFVLREPVLKSRGFAPIRAMLRDGNSSKSLKAYLAKATQYCGFHCCQQI